MGSGSIFSSQMSLKLCCPVGMEKLIKTIIFLLLMLVCPKCLSQDISPNLSLKAIALGTFQHEHKCNSCGYEGIFPEIEKVKKK